MRASRASARRGWSTTPTRWLDTWPRPVHDPFRTEELVKKMGRDDFSRAGEVLSSGMAVFEMACWDIVGKALDQPVYNLLGGPVRDKVKAYANGWYRVERTPEEFHAAARKVVERGYRALKLDPFGPGHYELERDEKLRSRLSRRCGTP